jgi:hypothetical protein
MGFGGGILEVQGCGFNSKLWRQDHGLTIHPAAKSYAVMLSAAMSLQCIITVDSFSNLDVDHSGNRLVVNDPEEGYIMSHS